MNNSTFHLILSVNFLRYLSHIPFFAKSKIVFEIFYLHPIGRGCYQNVPFIFLENTINTAIMICFNCPYIYVCL